MTGYHRKSLLRRLNQRPDERQTNLRGQHRRRYGPEVVEALVPLWEASDRLCGKRLHALLPQLLESLEHHGHVQLEKGVRARVLTMSSATIDRLLAPVRKSSGGHGWRRPPRAHSGVRRRVQVRTFKGWDEHKEPGWLEIDLVAHCGGRMEGRFIWTLVATDIASGWSESLPVITRDGASVLAAIQRLRQHLPFPLRGIDADNDPAFMNALMEQWCDAPEQGIELTRSRAYQSNDQAWVEQKNGVLIRRVVGYERLVGLEAAQLLGELYAALRLFTNLFQPSFKLKSSVREGGRIKRLHHPPRTPLQQLLRTGVLSDQEAQDLKELRKRCDPVALLATMRSCQSRLALLISGQHTSAMAGEPLSWQTPEQEKRELEGFLQGLQALWRQSRPRQKKPKPRQGRRSRVDPFEAHADLIPQWLAAEPDVGSQELLDRLIDLDPQRYGPQHKRTLQRRIRDWRVARVEMRWVPFIGQMRPLTSLASDGRNGIRHQCRPHGEFCLPGSYGALHGSTSTGSGPG
ncbi:integrase catalytic domain-containing protein [Cyanobium gracile]|uniref:integrase catalytic domain-containing protein n=1 Tax=Cyanobium gracile TaxID=59930 RepID=UPI00090061A2|nr:transposase [Cyanobium gracile]